MGDKLKRGRSELDTLKKKNVIVDIGRETIIILLNITDSCLHNKKFNMDFFFLLTMVDIC